MDMKQPTAPDNNTASEQLTYATVLHWCTLAGFVLLILTFLAYVLGWLPAAVPLEKLPQLWRLPTDEYLKAAGAPTGWSWLFMLGKGDYASLLGIAVLSGCSIACIAAILPIYAKIKNPTYVVICVVEIAVLVASASGIFGTR